MASSDVDALFAAAEANFRGGRYDTAREGLQRLLRLVGEHGAVLHLLALVEQNSGKIDEARAAFRNALRKLPHDPHVHNNYANLLDKAGELEAALGHYDQALAAAPGFGAALLNRATTLQSLGRFKTAFADLDRLVTMEPRNATARASRGAVRRLLGDHALAITDFEAALRIEPGHTMALHGSALLALEGGEEALAVPVFRRLLAEEPDDPEVLLGLAEALEASGQDGAITLLADGVARNPLWISGHESLARMRSEVAEDQFDAGYTSALNRHPENLALHHAHWKCLARGNKHAAALNWIDAAPAAIRNGLGTRLIEATIASEAGHLDRADAAFASLGRDQATDLARARHALRRHDPAAAAACLEPLIRRDPGAVAAWAYLGIAWRMLDDARYEWLCLQPGLYGVQQLGLNTTDIERLGALLRSLHRARAHPIGQSLRGGTQSRGELFRRPEPEIAALSKELRAALMKHVAGMPGRDDSHPLLRFRDQPFIISRGWSVRLAGGGFHVNHIHPAGVLSSACYIALPEEVGGAGRPGWLEIGAPPAELGLDLTAVETIEPKPGRLILFPSYFFHGTRPFAEGERLTVAFDVVA